MRFLTIAALLLLAACSAATPYLDEHTGTTLEQRCADRRAFIAGVEYLLSQGTEVSEETMLVYNSYRAFVAGYCPALPPASTDAAYARARIAEDGSASEAEWLASGVLKDRYQIALEAFPR